jgi:hypothetical protein
MSNLGFQPKSVSLRLALATALGKMEPDEKVIVHHVTDTAQGVQFEVERRSQYYGIRFERVKML